MVFCTLTMMGDLPNNAPYLTTHIHQYVQPTICHFHLTKNTSSSTLFSQHLCQLLMLSVIGVRSKELSSKTLLEEEHYFLLFPTMFSILSQTNFAILATFQLSSANSLNLDTSNILPFGKQLNKLSTVSGNKAIKEQSAGIQYFFLSKAHLKSLTNFHTGPNSKHLHTTK